MADKKVQTVLGDISPRDVGVTLTHEHLSMDFSFMGVQPTNELDKRMVNCPYTLENFGWIQRNPFSHPYNLLLNDAESQSAVLEEMRFFKLNGGGTIVENSTTGLGRNVAFLRRVATETNINVIAGAGFYIGKSQSESVKNKSVEELSQIIKEEMTHRTDGVDVKCGFIGEIASIYPIQTFEGRVLKASGVVQSELGCGVMIHPHRVKEAPYETLRIYLEAGGRADKIVMAHLDRTLFDVESLLDFAELGTFMEFDMFGIECSHYQLNDSVDMPSDASRIQLLKRLIEEDKGLQERIVLAHDNYAKHRLMKFGGHGYSHLLKNIRPKMLSRGITQEAIDNFFIHNPAKWLAF
ncbi:hypothetical protein CHUAL_006199 [Chamberlinius hualienensis]